MGMSVSTRKHGPSTVTSVADVELVGPATILAYHEVLPENDVSLYTVSRKQLCTHLRFVAERQARAQIAAPLITFDDGHISNFEHALPLLSEFAVHAVFFVTVGWMDRKLGYMSWSQARELAARGHSVQSHSWSHPLLTHVSPRELQIELCASKDLLEQKLGVLVNSISMPAGRWNHDVLAACANAGYKRVFVSEPWVYSRDIRGLELLGRFMVRRDTTVERLAQLCDRSKLLFWSLRAQHEFKRAARRFVGDRLYQHIWRRIAGRPTGV
jgi:peptidoglycan/xylan/chitin deacetylase (PgdA/CDA1 family)